MSAHKYQQESSQAPLQLGSPQDPSPGNTTAGAGILPNSFDSFQLLSETNASTPEIRTLADPTKAGIYITFILFAKNGQNLVIRCNTPIWLGATVTQPALTQNGQFITFSTVNHSCQVVSVPCTKISFTGTQSTITNATGFRWMLVQSDGPTVT